MVYYTSFRRGRHCRQRRQPQSQSVIDQSKGENRSASEPSVFFNLIDNVGSIQNYVAVVVARERVAVILVLPTEPVDIHGCPIDCKARQLVNFGKSFRDSKPTPNLRLRNGRQL